MLNIGNSGWPFTATPEKSPARLIPASRGGKRISAKQSIAGALRNHQSKATNSMAVKQRCKTAPKMDTIP